jgi:hypothetical protein
MSLAALNIVVGRAKPLLPVTAAPSIGGRPAVPLRLQPTRTYIAAMAERFEVDSWRFLPPRLARFLQSRIDAEGTPESIPFTPLRVPIAEARVALLSTAGISCPPDPPFDMDGERSNPTWGDPSWRRIAANATEKAVEVNHLHIDTSYIERDLDVALPLRRLDELVAAGEVGAAAPTHYSVMGYQPDATAQVTDSAPAIAARMLGEEVQAAVLAPV